MQRASEGRSFPCIESRCLSDWMLRLWTRGQRTFPKTSRPSLCPRVATLRREKDPPLLRLLLVLLLRRRRSRQRGTLLLRTSFRPSSPSGSGSRGRSDSRPSPLARLSSGSSLQVRLAPDLLACLANRMPGHRLRWSESVNVIASETTAASPRREPLLRPRRDSLEHLRRVPVSDRCLGSNRLR